MKPSTPSASDKSVPLASAEDDSRTASTGKVRVLIVDDHPITRHGIKQLLNQQTDLEVCGETDDAGNAIDLLGEFQPDVAIVDVALRSTSGLDLTKNLRTSAPNLPILVVSMHDEALYADRALRAGAMGYVMKQDAAEKVVIAIRHLLRGEFFLSGKQKERMPQRFSHARKRPEETVFAIDTLSDREMEVFLLIGEGWSTRHVAAKLGLSSKTIDSYREHIKLKLGLENGGELVRHAIQWARAEATE